MAPKNIKVIYFDAKGRGEALRLILAAAGEKYEDVRIPREKWPEEKKKTPFGQVPVLEIDGHRFGESVALATYLAREFGFYGKSNLEALQIDQVVQLVEDFIHQAVKVFSEQDEAQKAEKKKQFKEVEVPKYFGMFEKLLKESGTGYFVGSSLTLADIYLYSTLAGLEENDFAKVSDNATLEAHCKKVESNEKIKAYIASRT